MKGMFGLACCLLFVGRALGGDLLIANATLYAEPGEAPLRDARILIRDGRIASVTFGQPVHALDAVRLDAGGRAVTAGLWNCHVHLIDSRLGSAPQQVLDDMLLRYGFTSVVDVGSMADKHVQAPSGDHGRRPARPEDRHGERQLRLHRRDAFLSSQGPVAGAARFGERA